MSEPIKSGPLPRSPELMNASDTGLLVVDAQEKLLAVVPDRARIEWNCRRLLDAAETLGVARAATVQYPEKLGPIAAPLAAPLADRLEAPASKLSFSASGCCPKLDDWRADGLYRVLVCGIETHVCIQQTALDLIADGWSVYVAVDSVGTRYEVDHSIGLRRMEAAGVVLTTTEAAMFEWCRAAGTAEFKQISALAKEPPVGT